MQNFSEMTERLDLFPGPTAPELARAHALLDAWFIETEGVESYKLKPGDVSGGEAFKKIAALRGREGVDILRAAVERAHWQEREQKRPGSRAYNTSLNYLSENTPQHFSGLLELLLRILTARKLKARDEDIVEMLSFIRWPISTGLSQEQQDAGLSWDCAGYLLRIAKAHVRRQGLSRLVVEEGLAIADFLRDPATNSQARAAKQRQLAEEFEFLAKTGISG